MKNKKKTNIDVLEAIMEMTLGEYGPLLIHEFRQMVLPKLKLSPFAYKELSDAEFNEAMENVKREVPHYRAWLMNPRNRLPELPADFFSHSLN
jgi:hypothetical protein